MLACTLNLNGIMIRRVYLRAQGFGAVTSYLQISFALSAYGPRFACSVIPLTSSLLMRFVLSA